MTLGIPLGASTFVDDFLRDKFETIDNAISLTSAIKDGRMAHNIHRVTAAVCRITHLIRLIPPGDVAGRWADVDDRQSAWFEAM